MWEAVAFGVGMLTLGAVFLGLARLLKSAQAGDRAINHNDVGDDGIEQ